LHQQKDSSQLLEDVSLAALQGTLNEGGELEIEIQDSLQFLSMS
jgi:hypothetical protein